MIEFTTFSTNAITVTTQLNFVEGSGDEACKKRGGGGTQNVFFVSESRHGCEVWLLIVVDI